jgi:G:T-mismatch repair DNA endonuclease (very short patch repair protein)
MFNCPRCNQEYPSYNSLSKHTRTAYKLSGEQLYREYHGIKEILTCKCGCGTPTKWRIDRGYGEYVSGHNARGKYNPMFGKTHSETARRNISQQRKEKFANGEYEIWQHKRGQKYDAARKIIGEKSRKENNPERASKISTALTGKIRSEEHQRNLSASIKKAWENEELREKQRQYMFDRITDKGWQIISKLEDRFAEMLEQLNIKYTRQYAVKEIISLYDFYLPEHKILIEVHGDFWHNNPNITKFSVPKYAAQISNVSSDKIKKEWCKKNNIPLLIFWESDINGRPFWVIQQLLSSISPT